MREIVVPDQFGNPVFRSRVTAVESPRVPEMTQAHVDAIGIVCDENVGIVEDALREIGRNVEAQASGRLQTYSPESEVRVPREAISVVMRDLRSIANYATNELHSARLEGLRDTLAGWLVSTKQEVSE